MPRTIRRLRPALLATAAGVAAASLGGCASQSTLDAAEADNKNLREQLVQRDQEIRSLRDSLDSEQRLRRQAEAATGDAGQALTQAQRELLAAQQDLEQFGEALDDIDLAIDPRTDVALRRLAQRFAGRILYDGNGMLRFASDLTFASGSDSVTDSGRESLAALAEVLNAPEATGYAIEVVGHTDSQQPSAGTRQRHATNMHLSVHRSIAVRRELVSMGLPAGRIKAAGWGEQRPLVPNTTTGNTPQNRRVEIFIRPDSQGATASFGGGFEAIEADIDDARGSGGRIIDK
ncbi:MAG: OmpA family protein [Planctomycetota bacterium]